MALAIAAQALGVGALVASWHLGLGRLLGPIEAAPGGALRGGLAALGFLVLFGVQVPLQAAPQGRIARALQPWLFAGLHLDEVFTRLTFRLWPPRLPRPEAAGGRLPALATGVEVLP